MPFESKESDVDAARRNLSRLDVERAALAARIVELESESDGVAHRDRNLVDVSTADHDVGVLRRMFAKRQKAYRSMGYEVR